MNDRPPPPVPALILLAASLLACGGTEPEVPSPVTEPAVSAAVGVPHDGGMEPAEDVLYDRWESFGREQGFPSDKVLSVLPLPDETWAGTENGLVRLKDGKVTVYGTADGLAHRVVTALARSPATGDLWIGTLGGLSRLSGGRFRSWRQSDSGLVNDVVYDVAVTGERIWVATAAGLGGFDTATGSWSLHDHTNAVFHEPWIYSVAPGGGALWIGVWGGGVVAHDPVAGTWREFRDPDGEMELELVADDGPVHDVTAGVSFANGVLWQATYFGVSRLSGGRWRTFLSSTSPLPSDFVNAVHASGRRAFLATDSGLCVTDGDAWATYAHDGNGRPGIRITEPGGEERVVPLAAGPPHDFIYTARATGRHVWVGTAAGLGHGWSPAGDRDGNRGASPGDGPERKER